MKSKGLKKYKSDDKLKQITSPTKKTTKKVPIQTNKLTSTGQKTKKTPKLLVTHPTIKKEYRKATNP